MIKATSTILLLSLAVLVASEPLRQRFVPRRGLARQEQAALPSPAPTGYPEAGVTPEVPFELPSSTAQPEARYLPPDNTYGPPDSVYGPPTSVDEQPQLDDLPEPQPEPEQAIETDDIPEEETPVDAKQQPAEDVDEEPVLVQVAEDGTVIAVSTTLDQPDDKKPARIYQRFPQARRRQQPVPERLVLRRSW
ncbi:E3 ubiquitin-protein ligase RNF12-B [Drosophila hydei]|uniref:E3 ubiquitin-protein ligase RNF12-B n=1 Tax=Drosophila hydei TaxID=7224 RepID=A0A6J1M470_DROHY|nr:E3 ubiquitin-protein ligase RNF12-B [Drosophila hydei]